MVSKVPGKARDPKRLKAATASRTTRKGKRSRFAHYFIPGAHNAHKPLFLRIEVASVTAAVILFLFCGASVVDQYLVTGNSPQVAAVVAATLVDLANADRTQNELASLTVDPSLQAAAQLKANDMAAKSYFAHESPDGHDPWYWFAQAGYSFTYAGENLAVYFSDSSAVNSAWMNSTEHRANILNPHFTQIGIATAQGMYQGQETVFVVQEFGTPSGIAGIVEAPAPDAVATTTSTSSTPQTAPVSAAGPARAVANTAPVTATEAPKVKGASAAPAAAQAPVQVLEETPTYITVRYIGAPAAAAPENTAGTTPVSRSLTQSAIAAFWDLATSPQTDLMVAYEIITVIVLMALALEVGVEFRRQHPHRIAIGFSLICFMAILLFAGHSVLVGNLVIA